MNGAMTRVCLLIFCALGALALAACQPADEAAYRPVQGPYVGAAGGVGLRQ
jgi:hypothetical protein